MAKNTEKALAALLNTSTVRDAATQSRLSEETIYRYLRDDEFKSEYQRRQNQIVEDVISTLKQTALEAVETLRRNLTCNNPQAEIRAAQVILDNVLGNSETDKTGSREIVISFNFNNQTVRLTNESTQK